MCIPRNALTACASLAQTTSDVAPSNVINHTNRLTLLLQAAAAAAHEAAPYVHLSKP